MSDVADPHLVGTREALHAVAEHVLAAALHRWNGRAVAGAAHDTGSHGCGHGMRPAGRS